MKNHTWHDVGGREGELLIVIEEISGVGSQLERAHALQWELGFGPDLAALQHSSGASSRCFRHEQMRVHPTGSSSCACNNVLGKLHSLYPM